MSASNDRMVHRWLVASALAVILAVAIGGITRLTESGLSITEWRPVSGVLPPRSAAEWDAAYQKYLAIPEAQTVHRGIRLAAFQRLYWWEWVHRLLARVVGLVLALPYFVLLARGRIRRGHRARLLLLPVLAMAQGALGWYMVRSGLEARVDVSAYRLTAHLALALAIFVVAVWTALDLRTNELAGPVPRRVVASLFGASALTSLTILSGGFVAGLDAGKIFNTFPLMGGAVLPPGYSVFSAWWQNALENPVAAQFHHRVLAMTTGVVLLLIARTIRSSEASAASGELRTAALRMGLVVIMQVALGITTLLLAVPVALGVLHQVTGVATLTAVLVTTHHAWSGFRTHSQHRGMVRWSRFRRPSVL